ncbi:mechanosensitive ion channel [Hymenobacter sp. H14-R3]|uniref:mechanosensitive ion channel family protein n=1 Tax=Hymenobacter sp. H14-R3 TaxID=3046308 RepID=UPI0024BA8A06|nr:mechanosensitive ion channel domain-containing protein [Hymenobacter sp. H14-R3]MDJ0367247.1 mechanosensitive ion channel [Hymenobacter sp. H14-R3]
MKEQFLRVLDRFPDGLTALLVMGGSLVGGWLLKVGLFWMLRAYERRTGSVLAGAVVRHTGPAAAFFLPVLLLAVLLPLATLAPGPLEAVRRVVGIVSIATFAWLLMRAVDVLEELVLDHYRLDRDNNLAVRKLLTQLQFVKKIGVSLIFFVAMALVLMSFATVRRIGAGLLTSAGIASVIVGFAAQRSLSNLLAGFQIAFTQPIRIDDVLVVEGEWGRVEEITFTNVILKIWDERRLVLPLGYFIEKPFQNWTRSSSQLLGTVFLYADYTIPVEAVRTELARIVADNPRWDGRVATVQVTDIKEHTLELRALVSAADASIAFDLRCEVREKLVAFIHANYPECLPKTRAIVEGPVLPA